MEAATTCFQWSKPIVPHFPSSHRTLTSAISAPSSFCHYVHRLDSLALFGASSTSKAYRAGSSVYAKPRRARGLKRACSTGSNAFSDEEFSKEIQELALRFQNSIDDDDDDDDEESRMNSCDSTMVEYSATLDHDLRRFPIASVQPPWPEISRDSSDWPEAHDIIPASIERNVNSVDIPLSLRIIKRKMQWQVGFKEAGESACCSVKKAFSSMVFIIRELQSYTLQMRELIFTEDLQGTLARVQKEMHDSFVWLFQQVFSHTPTLMVSVMILLANFTVYSMGTQYAIAAVPATERVSILDTREHKKFHSSVVIKTIPLSSPERKSAPNGGGGGNIRPVGSGTEEDGSIKGSDELRTIVPDDALELSALGTGLEAEQEDEDASKLWNRMVEEASNMQGSVKIDQEVIKRLVSPIEARIESDDNYGDEYVQTEVLYLKAVGEEPYNGLFLANYAQFLYLISHDYDRAEEYFKRAVGTEPVDAEALSKYATFLWKVRNDVPAAEETFLEAMAVDPESAYFPATYAAFLWTTGGEDTCFPLGSMDATQQV
ncbi:hypothetical protein LINGRAPRIM_LOCUS1596 [Linum grandiflorum]